MHPRHRANFRVFDPLAFLADEVDPLRCSRCGGTMKVISVSDQEAVIDRILAHLQLLPPGDGSRAPPTEAGSGLPVRCRTQTGSPAGVGLRALTDAPVYDLPAASACLPSLGDRQAPAGDLPGAEPA